MGAFGRYLRSDFTLRAFHGRIFCRGRSRPPRDRPPYFKTADPMPMLRPPDLVTVGAIGTLMDQRPGGYWGVRFEAMTVLVDEAYLAVADLEPEIS
ncbi:MAG: DUF3148 domain-containing protein [Leptolyngbya sp. RL_3_1]|nr:DUF3148 domain-containing protein [Leptolyngbya sp. RL_3_1]